MNQKKLNNKEMEKVVGGSITSPLINAISKAIGTIYELGKQTGSSIRRLVYGKYCPIN